MEIRSPSRIDDGGWTANTVLAGPAFWDATADHLFRRHRRWSEKC